MAKKKPIDKVKYKGQPSKPNKQKKGEVSNGAFIPIMDIIFKLILPIGLFIWFIVELVKT